MKSNLTWYRTKFSSTMTLYQLSCLQLPRLKLSNCVTNCYFIHPILQILYLVPSPFDIFCLLAWYEEMAQWKKIFKSNEEIFVETNILFCKVCYIFLEGLKKLVDYWMKYIELKGDYLKKKCNFDNNFLFKFQSHWFLTNNPHIKPWKII